ncbi:MAG: dTMP kinase [Alphaproteobacteria bacterium]
MAEDANPPFKAPPRRKRGMFISFEGGEGSGKSTQVKLLAERLKQAGISSSTTREPGGSPSAEDIRKLLVSGSVARWDPLTELLLHTAARREHLRNLIQPVLNRGVWLISDRFVDSTMAYQGYGLGLGRPLVEMLHKIIADDFMPDLTLVLDIPTETGIARAKARSQALKAKNPDMKTEDRYERMAGPFHRRLRRGFLDIAKQDPERCRVIDASGDIEEVAAKVWAAVAEKFALAQPAV